MVSQRRGLKRKSNFPQVRVPIEPEGYSEQRRIEQFYKRGQQANTVLERLYRGDDASDPGDPLVIAGTQVRSFIMLQRLHNYLAEARRELETIIGVKLCTEHCCCIRTTPYITRIEAEYIVSHTGYYSHLVDIAEEWLVRDHREAPTYPIDLPGAVGGMLRQMPVVAAEVKALHNLRSPFLLAPDHVAHRERFSSGRFVSSGFEQGQNWDLLDETQPLTCLAAGVTKLAPPWCHRPQGLGESAQVQVIADPATLRKSAKLLWDFCERNVPDKLYFGLLPTMLLMVANPRRFEELAKSGKVALAKLGVTRKVFPPNTFPIRLWETEVV